MSQLNEEQRIFINNLRLENKTLLEIQEAFREKWDRTVSTTTINRYSTYHLWGKDRLDQLDKEEPKSDEPPKDDEPKDGALKIKVKKTLKDKPPKDEIVHFSDGEMNEADFKKIVALRGTSEEETFNFLKLCGQKGYTKINMKTGEISE